MEQIFIELIFLDNFLLDFVLLFFSCRICEKRARFPRLCAGAAIGGIYSLGALWLPLLTTLPAKLLFSALMCLSDGFCPWQGYLRRLCCFYCISFLFSGILYALQAEPGFPMRGLLAGVFLLCIFTECLARRGQLAAGKQYRLCLQLYGHTLCLQAMVDTGNALQDAAGEGVILLDKQLLAQALSAQEYAKLLSPTQAELPVRTFICHTAAGEASLYGFCPAQLTLTVGRTTYALKAYLVLADLQLPAQVHALLPPHLHLYPLYTVFPKEGPHVQTA